MGGRAEAGEEGGGGGGEGNAFAPGEVDVALEKGAEGAEDEGAREGGGQDAVDAHGRAKSRGDEGEGVVGEVVGGGDVQREEVAPQPAGEEVRHARLPRNGEGEAVEVARADGLFRGEGGVAPQVEAPAVDVREDEVVVAVESERADEEREVDGAGAYGVVDLRAVAARDGDPEVRVFRAQGGQGAPDGPEGEGFARADGEGADEALRVVPSFDAKELVAAAKAGDGGKFAEQFSRFIATTNARLTDKAELKSIEGSDDYSAFMGTAADLLFVVNPDLLETVRGLDADTRGKLFEDASQASSDKSSAIQAKAQAETDKQQARIVAHEARYWSAANACVMQLRETIG